MPTLGRKHYKIKRVDVSTYIIRSAFEADEENAPEWFEAQAEAFFLKNILNQVDGVGIDELTDSPLELNRVKDPHSGLPTFYFVFHGEDDSFYKDDGEDFTEGLAYVSVLVDANTGEAYAVETEVVE
jgi:hypothetical protein